MRFAPSTGTFYPRDIAYPSLPVDLVDVSREDFDAAMQRPAGAALALVNGRVVIVPAPEPDPAELLAAAIAGGMAQVDAAAAAARARHITPGMEAIYAAKAAQASELLASAPGATPGAYLVAEAAARGVSPIALASTIAVAADEWDRVTGPAIEAARQAGKVAVRSADSAGAVRAAVDAASAALAAL